MDLSIVFNPVLSLFNRFFNWTFVIWGVTVHVYSIFIFVFLVVLLVKFIDFLRGV